MYFIKSTLSLKNLSLSIANNVLLYQHFIRPDNFNEITDKLQLNHHPNGLPDNR